MGVSLTLWAAHSFSYRQAVSAVVDLVDPLLLAATTAQRSIPVGAIADTLLLGAKMYVGQARAELQPFDAATGIANLQIHCARRARATLNTGGAAP